MIKLTGPFVVFSLVFYTGQVIGRFFKRYDDMLEVSHASAGIATTACSFIKSPKYVEAIVRYSLTLVHMHYLVLDDDLSTGDWRYLLNGQLLTPAEVASAVNETEPIAVVHTWCVGW